MSEWPCGIEVSDEPVRRVHTRSRRRDTQIVFSTKPRGMRVAESSHEERFLKVAQLDPHVTVVRMQPAKLRVLVEGRWSQRTPDAAVIVGGRAEIHEIKEDAEYARADVRSALRSIRDEIERHRGWHYSVTLDRILNEPVLKANTNTLWRCLGDEYHLDLEQRTRELLDDGPVTAAEAIERTAGDPDGSPMNRGSWENLCAMIADGFVHYDIRSLLTRDSLVWTAFSGPMRERTLPFHRPHADDPMPVAPPVPAFVGLRLRIAS